MKYMTPELLARMQSEDEAIAEAADNAWQKASRAYNAHVEKIRPSLTDPVQLFLDSGCLHDARVLVCGSNKRQFSILVRLDSPPGEGLLISYQLVGSPAQVKHSKLANYGKPWGWVLYDEIELVKGKHISTYSHALLFTGGRELHLPLQRLAATALPLPCVPGHGRGRWNHRQGRPGVGPARGRGSDNVASTT
jgi:hypothetical protein